MSQFSRYEKFSVDGWNMTMWYNLYIVTEEEDESYQVGHSRTIQNLGSKKSPIYKIDNTDSNVFSIQIVKMIGNEVVKIDDNLMKEINRILFKNDIVTLEINGFNYYGAFNEGSVNNKILNIHFESASAYRYSLPINGIYRCVLNSFNNYKKVIEINNNTNTGEAIPVNIEILALKDCKSLTIKNGSDFQTINDIKKDDYIVIDSESREIFNKNNDNENVYKRYSYSDYLTVKYGKKQIEILGTAETDIKILFKYQIPVLIS